MSDNFIAVLSLPQLWRFVLDSTRHTVRATLGQSINIVFRADSAQTAQTAHVLLDYKDEQNRQYCEEHALDDMVSDFCMLGQPTGFEDSD